MVLLLLPTLEVYALVGGEALTSLAVHDSENKLNGNKILVANIIKT